MHSTITSKGQVTIPVEVRRAVGLDVGMQVEFIVNHRQRVELIPRHGDVRALRGAVPAPASAVTVKDMSELIAAGWSGNSTPASEPTQVQAGPPAARRGGCAPSAHPSSRPKRA